MQMDKELAENILQDLDAYMSTPDSANMEKDLLWALLMGESGGVSRVLVNSRGPPECFTVLVQGLVDELPRLWHHGVPGSALVPSIAKMSAVATGKKRLSSTVVSSFFYNRYLEALVADGSSVCPTARDLDVAVLEFSAKQPALSGSNKDTATQEMSLELLAG
jgi:hypothetical protein